MSNNGNFKGWSDFEAWHGEFAAFLSRFGVTLETEKARFYWRLRMYPEAAAQTFAAEFAKSFQLYHPASLAEGFQPPADWPERVWNVRVDRTLERRARLVSMATDFAAEGKSKLTHLNADIDGTGTFTVESPIGEKSRYGFTHEMNVARPRLIMRAFALNDDGTEGPPAFQRERMFTDGAVSA